MARQEDSQFEKYVEARVTALVYELHQQRGPGGQGGAAMLPAAKLNGPEDLLTQSDIAEELSVSVAAVQKWDRAGELERVPRRGRLARYTRREVDRFKRKRE